MIFNLAHANWIQKVFKTLFWIARVSDGFPRAFKIKEVQNPTKAPRDKIQT